MKSAALAFLFAVAGISVEIAARAAATYTQPAATVTVKIVDETIDPVTGNLHVLLQFTGCSTADCRPRLGFTVPAAGGAVVADDGHTISATTPAAIVTDLSNLSTDLASALSTAATAGKFDP